MKFTSKILNFILFLVFVTACTTNVNEPNKIETYNYELSKVDAQLQTRILLDETITILLEAINKRSKATKTEFELIKKNSTQTNYYSNGWYIWQNRIYSNPFGENNAYTASYISKIFFNKPTPKIADTTKSSFSVHTKFGFLKNSIYGDEVDFSINTLLLASPYNNNTIPIEVNAKYKRHWVANYDGIDSDLQYEIKINSRDLKYIFSQNSSRFQGHLDISTKNIFIDAQFNKVGEVLINFFKNNNLVSDYSIRLNSLLMSNNLQKRNNDAFPGSSAVNEKFINLLSNFPDKNSEILPPNF